MIMSTNERFTYSNMRILEIKSKLFNIDPNMKEPDPLEIINLSLVTFSMVCDAHTNPELDRHEMVQDMIENVNDFIYYVNDFIKQTNQTNDVLNEYLEKHLLIKRNEAGK